MIETGGWDTHAGQRGRLAGQLNGLDQMVGALQKGSGRSGATRWCSLATEFGRTVKINGTQGTDHGTGSVAMLMGGAVNGGRVVADWPRPYRCRALRESRPEADPWSRCGDRLDARRAFRA